MNTKKMLITLIAFMFILTGCSFNKNKDAIVEVNDKVILLRIDDKFIILDKVVSI